MKKTEYWSGQPFPSLEDPPDPGTELRSPALQADSLLSKPPKKPITWNTIKHLIKQKENIKGE